MLIFEIKRPALGYYPGAWHGDTIAYIAADDEEEAWNLSGIKKSEPIICKVIGVAVKHVQKGVLFQKQPE